MYCVMYIMFEFIIDRGKPEGPMPGLTPMGGVCPNVCPKTMVGGGDLKIIKNVNFSKYFLLFFKKKFITFDLHWNCLSNYFRHQ